MTEKELFGQMKGRTVAMLGAGVSNMPLISLLAQAGALVTVRDRAEESTLGERGAAIRALGCDLITGEGYLDGLSEDFIFRSPGIRPDLPEICSAVSAGSVLTSEMDLFLEKAPVPVYGVTGSDGKSTTTTLISLLLEEEMKRRGHGRAFLGGNIGEPLLHRIPLMEEGDAVAAELSSFQLMTAPSRVKVAVITNVTPNHLNWHTGMEEYIRAKARILEGCERAVLNGGCPVTRELGRDLTVPVTYFSAGERRENLPEKDSELFLDGEVITRREGGIETPILSRADIVLPGLHNVENYMAAIGATWGFVSPDAVRHVARTFGGVAHRLERVREKDGVTYYNSSIDSSPTRTLAALSALGEREVVIILGGYDKKIPFAPLAEGLALRGHIRAAVLTGATAPLIDEAMKECAAFRESGIPVLRDADFDRAFALAAEAARPGDAVLLSPACASFDAFKNFEQRGEHFRDLVNSL